MSSSFVSGQFNAICDICGFEYKSGEMKKNWKGQMVCKQDYELRHPLDFLRVQKEVISPPWTRPEPTPTFITFRLLTEASDTLTTESNEPLEFL